MLSSFRAALDRGDVLVRYRSTDALGADAPCEALACLSADERARHDRIRFDGDRRDFAVAHALLRTTLSEVAGLPPAAWRFDTDGNGKPRVAPDVAAPPVSFTLSHTRGFVACAVALDAEIGIDVERVARDTPWRAIASRYFSSVEVRALSRLTAPEQQAARFIELWTLKEAWSKATGAGLARSLDAVTFDITDEGDVRCTLPPALQPKAWRFRLDSPEPGVRMALAVSAD